ncbi:MAG: hypothetical protein AB2A00_42200, partial [Myxococcota bacterium]
MTRPVCILAILLAALPAAAASTKKAPEPAKEAAAEPAPAKKKTGAPTAPPPRKQEGPSGVKPKDGTCPPNLVLTPRGTLMRAGMGLNFAVFHLMQEDRCLPRILQSADGNWTMLEFEQGRAGWVQAGGEPLSFGEAPPLPEGNPQFEVLLTETTLGHVEPSLISPVVGVVKEGVKLQVHVVSGDGLMYLVSSEGVSQGWVLKGMVRREGETEARAAGSGAWAPPPLPADQLPKGSVDAMAPP